MAGSASGTPALSPAALHLEFNDVSIFRVGGVTVSDAMLPVGHSDSMLGPLQVGVVRWRRREGGGGVGLLFFFMCCMSHSIVAEIWLTARP